MDPLSILGIIQQAFQLGKMVKTIYQGTRDAPTTIRNLTAEAQCIEICLKILMYEDTVNMLRKCNPKQFKDLKIILKGCEMNAKEMLICIQQLQWIVAENHDPNLIKQRGWRKIFRIPGAVKKLWAKVDVGLSDYQPMRNKLAIPLQSLNIFLVSLTFVYVPRPLKLPHHTRPAPGKLSSEWNVVGELVAFKSVKFDAVDLADAQVENRIVNAAECLVRGRCDKACRPCCACSGGSTVEDNSDDDSARPPFGGSGTSPSTQTKSRSTSDQMFLVRRKSRGGERSKPAVRRVKREVVSPSFDPYAADEPARQYPGFVRGSSSAIRSLRAPSPAQEERLDGAGPASSASSVLDDDSDSPEPQVIDQSTIEEAKRAGREAAKRLRQEAARHARAELETGVDLTERAFEDAKAGAREARHRRQQELRERESTLNARMDALNESRQRRHHYAEAQESGLHSPQERTRLREEMRAQARSEARERRMVEEGLDVCAEMRFRESELDDINDEPPVAAQRPGVQTYMRLRYGIAIYAATEQSILINETFAPDPMEALKDEDFDSSDMSDDEDYVDYDIEINIEHGSPAYAPDRLRIDSAHMLESTETNRTHREERRRALFTIPPNDYRPSEIPPFPSERYTNEPQVTTPYFDSGRHDRPPHSRFDTDFDRILSERRRHTARQDDMAERETMLQRRESALRERESHLHTHEYGGPTSEIHPGHISRRRVSRERSQRRAPYVSDDEGEEYLDERNQYRYRDDGSPSRSLEVRHRRELQRRQDPSVHRTRLEVNLDSDSDGGWDGYRERRR